MLRRIGNRLTAAAAHRITVGRYLAIMSFRGDGKNRAEGRNPADHANLVTLWLDRDYPTLGNP
jgi:hypothetical protein